MNPYETDELVAQYMAFHYGESYYDVANYPAICARHCLQLVGDNKKTKALDLGCSVGRTTLELAHEFDQVIGIDLSARFIECATQLVNNGSLDYKIIDEGELVIRCTARLAELDLDQARSRVLFQQGDACNLTAKHRGYELIFAGNLLDRLKEPEKFLSTIHQNLAPGGILVMSSPYTLLNEFTPRANWLGGYVENGQAIHVLDGIKKALEPNFTMIQEPINIPFVIRETSRKFQHTIAELTGWRRKS